MNTQIMVEVILGSTGVSLPYAVDFTALPDGNLPAAFGSIPTWAVSGGKAVCTPTEGVNILTNPGLEGTPPNGWAYITSSAASVADPRPGSAGAACYEVTASAADGAIYQSNTLAQIPLFFIARAWAKPGTSNASLRMNGGNSGLLSAAVAGWNEYVVRGFRTLQSSIFWNLRVTTNGGTARFDDTEVRPITGVFGGMRSPRPLITVRANVYTPITGTEQSPVGVYLCANDRLSPTSMVLVIIWGNDTGGAKYVRAYKVVNGAMTALFGSTSVVYVAGAPIEIRRTASTTFQIFYNGTQVSTDQTITDTEIVNNQNYCGMIATGGAASVDAFFLL